MPCRQLPPQLLLLQAALLMRPGEPSDRHIAHAMRIPCVVQSAPEAVGDLPSLPAPSQRRQPAQQRDRDRAAAGALMPALWCCPCAYLCKLAGGMPGCCAAAASKLAAAWLVPPACHDLACGRVQAVGAKRLTSGPPASQPVGSHPPALTASRLLPASCAGHQRADGSDGWHRGPGLPHHLLQALPGWLGDAGRMGVWGGKDSGALREG